MGRALSDAELPYGMRAFRIESIDVVICDITRSNEVDGRWLIL